MIHDFASFVRWRLKPNRWAAKGVNMVTDLPRRLRAGNEGRVFASASGDVMRNEGYLKLDRTIETPRINLSVHAGEARGKAFVDLRPAYREVVDPLTASLLADPEVGGMIMSYFDGRPWLWNVALNFSEPSDTLLDSQLWHFDYGDTRQLHLLVYFTDVTLDSGPFTFLPKQVSDKVSRHPFVIERMTDADLSQRFGIDTNEHVVRLTGARGEIFVNDPGILMHQGARCKNERLVLFVTFTSPSPMSRGGRATISSEDRRRFGELYNSAASPRVLPAATFD